MFGGSLGQDQAVMELGAMKPLNENSGGFCAARLRACAFGGVPS